MAAAPRARRRALSQALGAALLAALVGSLAGAARAQDRDFVLRILPPPGEVTGYRAYVVEGPTQAEEVLELGFVPPDADGVARAVLILDGASWYMVGVTAYNGAGESELSNVIQVDAVACDASLCDDGNPCTADSCDAAGCWSAPLPDGSVCDDGYIDTVDDQCVAGVCEGVQLACYDDLDCDDGDVCNGLETCEAGTQCLAGDLLDCGEPTQCADPTCDPETGCWMAPRADGSPCDDGSIDTLDDRCVAGVCQGSPAAAPLAIDSVAPSALSPGFHDIQIRGQGFAVGAALGFENGQGRAPRVRWIDVVDDGTIEARIDVSSKGPRRPRPFDVVVTLPDGRQARLGGGLVVEP